MNTRQFCKGWCWGRSDFESSLFYKFVCLWTLTLPWQTVLHTVIGLSPTCLEKCTDPCDTHPPTLVGHRVLLVTTGCHSSGLALRVTASRPPPDHEEMSQQYSSVTIADNYRDNSVELLIILPTCSTALYNNTFYCFCMQQWNTLIIMYCSNYMQRLLLKSQVFLLNYISGWLRK